MSSEKIGDCPRSPSPKGAHANSTLSAEVNTRRLEPRLGASESCLEVFPTPVEPSATGVSRCAGAVEEATQLDSWKGGATDKVNSTETIRSPCSPLWLSLQGKFLLHHFTSMVIPYSICPLLPNFPFAYSLTVFCPDLSAVLPGSDFASAARVDASSANPEEPSTAGSASSLEGVCTRPSRRPTYRTASPGERAALLELSSNTTGQRNRVQMIQRKDWRSFSGSWDSRSSRASRPALVSTKLTEQGNMEKANLQQPQERSGTERCKLSRSLSEGTRLKLSRSDEPHDDVAGATLQNKSATLAADTTVLLPNPSVSLMHPSGGVTGSEAGPSGALSMTTLDHLKRAAASLSLNKRLLLLLLLLPWALTVACYTYVPRRMRRRLQWLFPNLLIFIVFVVILAGCLQCQFSIMVDLVVLTLQLCSWVVLAVLSPASADRSNSVKGLFSKNCRPASVACASSRSLDSERAAGNVAARSPRLPQKHSAAASQKGSPMLTRSWSTGNEAPVALPPENKDLPLSSKALLPPICIRNLPLVPGQCPSVPVNVTAAKSTGAAGDEKALEKSVVSGEDNGGESEQMRKAAGARTAEMPVSEDSTGFPSVRAAVRATEWTHEAGDIGGVRSSATSEVEDGGTDQVQLHKNVRRSMKKDNVDKQAQIETISANGAEKTLHAGAPDTILEALHGGHLQGLGRGEQQHCTLKSSTLSSLTVIEGQEIPEVGSKINLATASWVEEAELLWKVESPATLQEQEGKSATAAEDSSQLQSRNACARVLETAQESPSRTSAPVGEPLLVNPLPSEHSLSTITSRLATSLASRTEHHTTQCNKEWHDKENQLISAVKGTDGGSADDSNISPSMPVESRHHSQCAVAQCLYESTQQGSCCLEAEYAEEDEAEAEAAATLAASVIITVPQENMGDLPETAADVVTVPAVSENAGGGTHTAAEFGGNMGTERDFSLKNINDSSATDTLSDVAVVPGRSVDDSEDVLGQRAVVVTENSFLVKRKSQEASQAPQQTVQLPAVSYPLFTSKKMNVDDRAASAEEWTNAQQRDDFATQNLRGAGEESKYKTNFANSHAEPVNVMLATLERQLSNVAVGGEENHSLGADRQDDDDESFCIWPSFVEEQSFLDRLHRDSAGAATHVDSSISSSASGMTKLDRLEAFDNEESSADSISCDFSGAESLYFNIPSEELLGAAFPKHHNNSAETNTELSQAAYLPEQTQSLFLKYAGQDAPSDWTADVALSPTGDDRSISLWQANGLSPIMSTLGVAATHGNAELKQGGRNVQNVQGTVTEVLPAETSVEGICAGKAAISAEPLVASTALTHWDRQLQREQQPEMQQVPDAHQQGQSVDAYTPSTFVRSPLLATENDVMWSADASLLSLRQNTIQSLQHEVYLPFQASTANPAPCLPSVGNAYSRKPAANLVDNNFTGAVNADSLTATLTPNLNSGVVMQLQGAALDWQRYFSAIEGDVRAPGVQGTTATSAATASSSTVETSATVPRIDSLAPACGSRVPEAATTEPFVREAASRLLKPTAPVERGPSAYTGNTMQLSEDRTPIASASCTTSAGFAVSPQTLTNFMGVTGGEISAEQLSQWTATPEMLSSRRKILPARNVVVAEAAVGRAGAQVDRQCFNLETRGLKKLLEDTGTRKKGLTVSISQMPSMTPLVATTLTDARGQENGNSCVATGGCKDSRGGCNEKRVTSSDARTVMQHYMALVKDCYRTKDSQGALQVLELLQKEKRVQPDTQLLNYILLVCVAAGSTEMMQRLFNLMERTGCADLVTYNTVLKSFVEAADLASAEKLLQRMQDNSNIKPDGVTYNLMVNACVVCRHYEKAWEYIDKIKAANLTVDVCEDVLLLSTCVDACCRLEECGILKNLLQHFERSNLRLNAHAYGTVIRAYGRLRDMRRVWELWHQQAENGVTPSSYTYGCMLDSLTTNHQAVAAVAMFQEMIHAGVADALHFSVLIKGLSKYKAEGARLAIGVYEMLKRPQNNGLNTSNCRCSSSSSGSPTVSNSCSMSRRERASIPSSVSTTYEEEIPGAYLQRKGDEAVLLRSVNDGNIKEGEHDEKDQKETKSANTVSAANSAFTAACHNEANKFNSRPKVNYYLQALNTISYNALLHLCVSTGHLREALGIFQDMQQHPKAVPDLITYSSIIKGLCCSNIPQGLEMALQLFRNMQQKADIKADAIIYNTLIQGAATRKRVQLVELLLQHMIDHGVPPSSYTLCQCVKLHGKCNNLRRVLELHRELPARFNFKADEYVYTAMISACINNGAPVLAARLVLDAYAAGQQLATALSRKVFVDLQQRRQEAEKAIGGSSAEARRAAVDHVLQELKQLMCKGDIPEQQQQKKHHDVALHSPQELRRQRSSFTLQQQQLQQHTGGSWGHRTHSGAAAGSIATTSNSSNSMIAGSYRGGLAGGFPAASAMQHEHQRQQEMQLPSYKQHRQRTRQDMQQRTYGKEQRRPLQKQHQHPQHRRHCGPTQRRLQQGIGHQEGGRGICGALHRSSAEEQVAQQQTQHSFTLVKGTGGTSFVAATSEETTSTKDLGAVSATCVEAPDANTGFSVTETVDEPEAGRSVIHRKISCWYGNLSAIGEAEGKRKYASASPDNRNRVPRRGATGAGRRDLRSRRAAKVYTPLRPWQSSTQQPGAAATNNC